MILCIKMAELIVWLLLVGGVFAWFVCLKLHYHKQMKITYFGIFGNIRQRGLHRMANANGGVTVQGNTQGIIVAHSGLYSIAERC